MTAETVGHATRDSGTSWHASLLALPRGRHEPHRCAAQRTYFFNEFFSCFNFFEAFPPSPTYTLRKYSRSRMRQLAGIPLLAYSTNGGKRRVNTSFALSGKIASCQLPRCVPSQSEIVGRKGRGSQLATYLPHHSRPVSGLTINCVALRPCGLAQINYKLFATAAAAKRAEQSWQKSSSVNLNKIKFYPQ